MSNDRPRTPPPSRASSRMWSPGIASCFQNDGRAAIEAGGEVSLPAEMSSRRQRSGGWETEGWESLWALRPKLSRRRISACRSRIHRPIGSRVSALALQRIGSGLMLGHPSSMEETMLSRETPGNAESQPRRVLGGVGLDIHGGRGRYHGNPGSAYFCSKSALH